MKTWKIGLIAASATIVGGLSSAVLWNGIAHGEWDLPGLQQQVQHVTEVINNHEGRITNLEGKVNTPSDQPTPTPVVVTKVVTEAAPQTNASTIPLSPTASSPEPTPSSTPKTGPSTWYLRHYDANCGKNDEYVQLYYDRSAQVFSYKTGDMTDSTQTDGSYSTCKQL